MGYIRFKISKELDHVTDQVCSRLGMKKAELARVALMEYLKSLSIIGERVKRSGP